MGQEPERKFFLRHFRSISHAMSTYEDTNLLINHLAEGTSRTFKTKGVSILLFDDREKELVHVGSYGLSSAYIRKGSILVDDKCCAQFTGTPVLIEDMQNDPRVQYPDAATNEGIVSMLSIPIKFREAVIGVMRLYHDRPVVLHNDDTESLRVLMEQLGLVIENNGLRNFLDQVKTALENLPLRMLEGL